MLYAQSHEVALTYNAYNTMMAGSMSYKIELFLLLTFNQITLCMSGLTHGGMHVIALFFSFLVGTDDTEGCQTCYQRSTVYCRSKVSTL